MSTGAVQWSPPAGMSDGALGMNMPMIILLYLINVGMGNTETQMGNTMNYTNGMQPMQSDMIAWFQYLNNMETEASKGGLTAAQQQQLAGQMAQLYKEMFGQSNPPASGGDWNLSGSITGAIGPSDPGYVDPNSDFGKWLIALTKANTDSNGNPINNWPGINGDASVKTVTTQLQDLWENQVPGSGSPNSFGYDLANYNPNQSGPGGNLLDADLNNLAANYWNGKQPKPSSNAPTPPTDYLTQFDTDANSCVNIFQGIGTQETTLLQQYSATENGYQSNGNSMIQSVSGLYSYINQHTGSSG